MGTSEILQVEHEREQLQKAQQMGVAHNALGVNDTQSESERGQLSTFDKVAVMATTRLAPEQIDKKEQLLIEVGGPKEGSGKSLEWTGSQADCLPVKVASSQVDRGDPAGLLSSRPLAEERVRQLQRQPASNYDLALLFAFELLTAWGFGRNPVGSV